MLARRVEALEPHVAAILDDALLENPRPRRREPRARRAVRRQRRPSPRSR
jgi:hypothetical protein